LAAYCRVFFICGLALCLIGCWVGIGEAEVTAAGCLCSWAAVPAAAVAAKLNDVRECRLPTGCVLVLRVIEQKHEEPSATWCLLRHGQQAFVPHRSGSMCAVSY
jgi:hypothetical protein